MIHILYSHFQQPLEPPSFHSHLQALPTAIQRKILSFRNWRDAHRTLLGNLLLVAGLAKLNLSAYHLGELRYTEFQKPYFEGPVDFNISHSGAYVVCALSCTNQVGIDVEYIKPVAVEDFKANFHPAEWQDISGAADTVGRFYHYWTQKEAFLKAVGVGLNFPLRELHFADEKILWEGQAWFSRELALHPGYSCHLSSTTRQPELVVERVDFT